MLGEEGPEPARGVVGVLVPEPVDHREAQQRAPADQRRVPRDERDRAGAAGRARASRARRRGRRRAPGWRGSGAGSAAARAAAGPAWPSTRSSSEPSVEYVGTGRAGDCTEGSPPPEKATAAKVSERSTASRAAMPAPLEKPGRVDAGAGRRAARRRGRRASRRRRRRRRRAASRPPRSRRGSRSSPSASESLPVSVMR